MELLCHDGNKRKKEPPKITERIIRNDYTLYCSDFYHPHDNRELVSDFANRNEAEYYYQFFREFHRLMYREGVYD